MAPLTTALWAGIALLMVVSIIELSFISSMVGWLHGRASQPFTIRVPGSANQLYEIYGKPANLLTDQGHTSNGAAGTAFVLIGLGGILALTLRNRANFAHSTFSKIIYHAWLALTVPACLLTLAALVYTFVITANHRGQTIDQTYAIRLRAQSPNLAAYALNQWTPENWYGAMLSQLTFSNPSDYDDVRSHYRVMMGWRWNLVPFFIIQLVVTVLAVVEAFDRRRRARAVLNGKLPA